MLILCKTEKEARHEQTGFKVRWKLWNQHLKPRCIWNGRKVKRSKRWWVDNAHGVPKSLRSSRLHLHLFSQMRVRAINAFAAAISGFRMFWTIMPQITAIIGGPFIAECCASNDASIREEPSASPYQAQFCVTGTETGIVCLNFSSLFFPVAY